MPLLLASCNGLNSKGHPPMVFALNLSSSATTLTLVKGEGTIVEFADVRPQESRALIAVPESEVFLRTTPSDSPARDWTDPSGTPYAIRLQPGHLYAVVVDPLGQAALYSLPETYSADPKVCIVNSTATTLSQVQVAPDWGKNIKVYAQDVVPMIPSEFYSFEPKTLGLFWQTLEQAPEGAHSVALGSDGAALRQVFETGRYYLFLAGDGAVRDLTPALD